MSWKGLCSRSLSLSVEKMALKRELGANNGAAKRALNWLAKRLAVEESQAHAMARTATQVLAVSDDLPTQQFRSAFPFLKKKKHLEVSSFLRFRCGNDHLERERVSWKAYGRPRRTVVELSTTNFEFENEPLRRCKQTRAL